MLDSSTMGPSSISFTANPDVENMAPLIAAVRQQRATSAADVMTRTIRRLANSCGLRKVILVACAGMAAMAAYVMLLSAAGIMTSPGALFAVLLAATLSSIAGFAFSAICGVMLLHMMSDPVQVVVIMMVSSIAMQCLSVALLWRDIDFGKLSAFLAGGIMGLPFGVALLLRLGSGGFREAIGALLTAYAAYALLKRPVTVTWGGPAADVVVGVLGGITGGLAGFPGAFVTVWCGMKGWDKRRQRGICQPFILVMQIMALATIEIIRPMPSGGVAFDLGLLQFIPPALLGTVFGLWIFKRMSDRGFTMTVNVLLLGSGVGLLV